MIKNYLLEDDEIIYTEEEAKILTYNFIDEQTKILEKEINDLKEKYVGI